MGQKHVKLKDAHRAEEPKIHLTPATLADADFLLALRNDPSARMHFIHEDVVKPEEHGAWLQEVLADPNRHLFMIRDKQEEIIGQVRFDIKDDEATVSITIAADQRGKGYGVQSIKVSSEEFLAHNPGVRQIIAEIKEDNDVSMRAFLRAGFKEYRKKEHKVYLILERELQAHTT